MNAAARGARASASIHDSWAYLLLISPAIVVLFVVTIIPLAYSLRTALSYDVLFKPYATHFVGLANFTAIVASSPNQVAFINTALYTLVTVTAEMVLGFLLAILLSRPLYVPGLLRTLLMVPILLSPIVVGLSWRYMYNPDIGIINQVLATLDIAGPHWLENPKLVFWAVMIPDIWQWTPFVTLVTLAGLHGISAEIHEAALLDGLSLRHLIWHIYLPLLAPVAIVILLIRVIDAIKTFDVVFMLTQGGPGLASMLVSIRAWILALINLNFGDAAALSYLLLLVMSLFAMALLRLLRQHAF